MTFGRIPWTSDQPIERPLLTQDNTTHTEKQKENILASSGNRTHDSSKQDVKVYASTRAITETVILCFFLISSGIISVTIIDSKDLSETFFRNSSKLHGVTTQKTTLVHNPHSQVRVNLRQS
jgi:hypothetical protein